MLQIDVTLADMPETDCLGLLVPLPFDTWDQKFLGCDVQGAMVEQSVSAVNSGQEAYWIRSFDPEQFRLTYCFEKAPGSPPAWLWDLPRAPFTASLELREQAEEIAGHQEGMVRELVDYAIGKFQYGHPEESILRGRDDVPALCGLTEGSCVDIHTWFISALGALGGEATYLHGFYFRENEIRSPGFHCWLATREDDDIKNWDLSHALIYDRIPAQSGLNPYPGERVVIGAGKDLVFRIGDLTIDCHLFCHPMAVDHAGNARRTSIDVLLRRG